MKKISNIYIKLFGLLIIPFFTSCEKIIPDLERNNPYDRVGVYFSRYETTKNSTISPGQTVYLKVFISNNTTSKKNDVISSIEFDCYEYISRNQYSNIDYGTIKPFEEKYGTCGAWGENYSMEFGIRHETPAGTKIKVNMTIKDSKDNKWDDSFEFTVN